mgnify:CR=1 FL=1
MQELVVEARLENLDKVNDFVNRAISEFDCSKKSVMQLGVIVEEIFVNIASYSYPEYVGEVTVRTEIQKDPLAVTLLFIDSGVKYNPLEKEDPNLELSVDERQIGGLGIYLVKNMVEKISYDYIDEKNILTLTKNLS